MSDRKIRVLVCRVGEQPSVEDIEPTLKVMQALVGGYVQVVPLDEGLDLWCNEDGRALGLPFNRRVPVPHDRLFHHELLGTFFLARREDTEDDVLSTSLTDEDIAAWTYNLTLSGVPEVN